MEKIRTEGLIVRTYPFQDYDRILSVFTPEHGLIKLLIKGAYSSKKGKGGSTEAMSRVEAFYLPKGEMPACRDIEVLDHHYALRKSLPLMNAVGEMFQAIVSTQMPEQAAPALYQLLNIFMKKLPDAQYPETVAVAFYLKVLLYEGLLSEDGTFDRQVDLSAYDKSFLQQLALTRHFEWIASQSMSLELQNKAKRLFEFSLAD